MKPLIKSNYFKLAKTTDIFHEDRRNRITITSHFVKNSDTLFLHLNLINLIRDSL